MPYADPLKRKEYYHRRGKKTTDLWRKKYRRWNDYQREYKRRLRGSEQFRFKDLEDGPPIDFEKLTSSDYRLLNRLILSKRRHQSKKVSLKANQEASPKEMCIKEKPVEKNKINWKAISYYAHKENIIRPKAVYTNSKSPYGIADELHGEV
jgi:hypothetical protein